MPLAARIRALETLLCQNAASPLREQLQTELDLLRQELDRSEQRHRESEERYRGLVEASFEGILIVVNARIVEANDVAAAMSGYDRAELIGKGPLDLMTPESAKVSFDKMQRGVTEPYLIDVVRKDGTRIRVEVHGRNVTYRGQAARVTSLRDVTERQRQQAQLRLEQERFDEQVQQAQKLESIAVLAGGVAHDFNNLLLAILGNTELAMMHVPPDSRARESLKQVQIAAHNAADLTRQLLAYGGRGRFVVQPLSLNDVVTEMGQLLRASIAKKVTIQTRLDPRLPLLEADQAQMRQIVMNLITNAAEAIGDARGTITVKTSLRTLDDQEAKEIFLPEAAKPGDYIALDVSDTGQGMDAEVKARIFEPFFSTKFAGRGLGLAAVLGIVRGHHGVLSVRSEPGQGATFTVLLPAPEAAVTAARSEPEATAQWNRNATVLIVDDEPAVLEVTARMLAHVGLSVLRAQNGREAIAHYTSQRDQIAVVLLDLTMPDLSGEETLQELRKLNPDVRVIVTSGYNLAESGQPVSGASAFLHKPYTLARLTEQLARVLD